MFLNKLMKYIKYLISFLLIFGLTVNECSIYSQINSTNYHQVSFVNTKRESNNTNSELYVYAGQTRSKKVLSIALTTYRNLKNAFSANIQIILKFQINLYKEINPMNAQRIFLNEIITSSNHYTSLYIA